MEDKKVKGPESNPKALLPIGIFLLLYLGNGIFFEYINPVEGQMGFYVVSEVLAFSIALQYSKNHQSFFSSISFISLCAFCICDSIHNSRTISVSF